MRQSLYNILIVFDHLKERLPFYTVKQCKRDLQRFTLIDVKGGVILLDKNEMHVVVKPECRKKWFNKRVFKLMKEVIEMHGCITTKVMNDYDVGHLFAKRLGFKETNKNEFVTTYELRSL